MTDEMIEELLTARERITELEATLAELLDSERQDLESWRDALARDVMIERIKTGAGAYPVTLAHGAYAIADAMMEARKG